MTETMSNGAANGTDTVMKEEHMSEAPMDSIQQADPTDPQPPPQPSPAPQAATQHEQLPAAPAVAAATPPAGPTASARPSSIPPATPVPPQKPVAHGGPTRQYLNANVTPHLLEGMKFLAANEPEKPLQWLSDFLKERSKEVEG